MCIDLVLRSSIDATNCLFTESDALRSDFFPLDPLSEISHAVHDALRPYGVESIDFPLTPGRVWHAIDEARKREGIRQ